MLYTTLRPGSDIGILYVVVCPLIFVLAYFFTRRRRKMVVEIPLHSINDPLVLELKVRFRLMDAGLLFREPASTNITEFGRSPGDIVAAAATGTQITSGNTSAGDKEKAVFEEVNEMFVQGSKHMSKSCMLQLFYGAFQSNCFGNKAQSLAIHTKAAGMSPKLDEAYLIFRRQRLLNERFSGGDLVDFIAFEQNLELARKHERKAQIAVVQFWSELLKRTPSYKRLQAHGATISSAISLAQTHYLSLIKLSPDTPHVFHEYHADELEEEQRDNIDVGEEDGSEGAGGAKTANLDLLSEDNGMITISGEAANLGIIVNTNAMALKIFGYKKHELVGSNIKKIVPSPFAESHDLFLSKYLQTGFAKVIDRARQVLGLNQFDTSGFMILQGDLRVKHFSRILGKLLDRTPILTGEEGSLPFLVDWFPDVTPEKMSEVTSRQGFKVTQFVRGVKHAFTLSGDLITINEVSCYILRVKFSAIGESTLQEGLKPSRPTSSMRPEERVSVCPFNPRRNRIEGDEAAGEADSDDPTAKRVMSSSQADVSRDMEDHTIPDGVELRLSPPHEDDNMDHSSSESGALPMQFSPQTSTDNLSTTQDGRPSSVTDSHRGPGGKKTSIDGRSIGSKARSASATSSYSQGTGGPQHVRKVIAIRNEGASKRLRWLYYSQTLCLGVLIILAIIQCSQYRDIYDSLSDKLHAITERANSAIEILEATDMARSIDLARVGGWWSLANSIDNTTLAREIVIETARWLKPELTILKNVETPNSMPNVVGPHDPPTYMLAMEATALMLDSLLETAQSPLDSEDLTTQIQIVLDNVPYSILDIMNTSARISVDEYTSYAGSNPTYIMANATIGPIICLLIQLVLVFPLYYKMERDRQSFLKMFYDIPKNVVKGIYESNYQRLQAAEEDDDEDDEFSTRLAIDKSFGSVQNLAGNDEVGKLLQNSDRNQPLEEMTAMTALRNWFLDQHHMAIKSLVMFGLAVIFFFTTAGITYTFMSSAGTAGQQVFWSAQRPILMEKSTFLLREAFITLTNNLPLGVNNLTATPTTRNSFNIQNANQVVDSLAWNEFVLVYGSPIFNYGFGPLASVDTSNRNYKIELINACNEYSPSDCDTFMNGVMSRGLNAALAVYFRMVKTLLTGIANGIAAKDRGYSVKDSLDSSIASLRKLHRDYIKPSLLLASEFYGDIVTNWSSWVSNFNIPKTSAEHQH
ncbi:hypothetical protein HDU76_011037 [Blyttiomyces sp. JEL0837]|nr:hypothetical protein HDU76_011037 [Blyttiomyces sp. JEL0837]